MAVARSAADAAGPPPWRKRAAAWLALALVAIAVAGTTAWWTLGRSGPKPIPAAADATSSAPAVINAAPPGVPTEATPALAPAAPVPEQAPVIAAEPVPATSPPATGLAEQDAEREAAERRAKAQAVREKTALEAQARALAQQQRQENERLMAERDVARRQAEQQRVQAQQQARDAAARPPPPPATQPRPPTPPQSMTVKDQCARSGNPITQALCEVRECIKPNNWNDPYCKQQQEANQRARPDN